MSVIGSNILAGASGQGGVYNLTNSLRFRSSASAYLNRTPTSSTNRRTFTFSAWIKRGKLSATLESPHLIRVNANVETAFRFEEDNTLRFFANPAVPSINLVTTQVFRDPSSWYHLVLAVDTTQATASNRVKMYVNGNQITTFNTAVYPTQNYETGFNQAVAHGIAATPSGGENYDGYMTEVNFIDGQALTPSSFGEYSATTGVWQPKKYAGTYGTNGFYLPFTDNSALTTSSNVGLGKDFSGNGNFFATNNISITSGATYDSMTDVPALTSATAANYCVLNPLNAIGTTATFSNANLTLVLPDASLARTAFATMGVTSGKYYWESTIGTTGATYYPAVGVNTNLNALPTNQSGADATGYMYMINGQKFNNGSLTSYGSSYTTNDVIGIALDMDAGTITFYKNNTSQGQAFSGLSGTAVPCFIGQISTGLSVNFGQRPFAYTPPTGFVALNTFNLPTPSIGATASTQANKYFDATLYTGNGSTVGTTQAVVNAGGFQPDWVWIKPRSAATWHVLNDSVRGANKLLYSNDSYAEDSVTDIMNSFNSNGFTVAYNSYSTVVTNANGVTYVGWQWKESASAGFDISIATSNASSIVTYNHSLGVAPSMVISKSRSTTAPWLVYHQSLGNNQYLVLNSTAGAASLSGVFSGTSTQFTITNQDPSANYVSYLFSEVAGYSKFGSYTGNGSADGTFVYTGFRPRYIMIKQTNSTNPWIIQDSARAVNNVTGLTLYPNSSAAEESSTIGASAFDFLSNGFKNRDAGSAQNGNGSTYIYMAFAENPFKYSLGK